jgi:catechol 2,3-dioxygenase-like lactoylglutathione lyase family enzyme
MIEPGNNIAIKVPLYKWAETVTFYRDRVGLEVIKEQPNSIAFAFGGVNLWIDKVEHQSQVDVWLELFCDDPEKALATLGSPKRDELEPLDNVNGHWTSDPAGTIFLVHTHTS